MKKYDLAVILSEVEKAANGVEEVAKHILAAIKGAKAKTLEDFNVMVDDAYKRNGWNQKIGPMFAGSELSPAPEAVRFYVSTIRKAYRSGMNVMNFATVGELRKATAKKLADARAKDGKDGKAPQLVGVNVSGSHQMNGAVWHDVIVLFEHLPADSQAKIEAQVRRLITQHIKAAPDFLKLVS